MNSNNSNEKIMIEEIKFVQDIIKRMASNSFMLKGWTVALVVATLLFKGTKFQVLVAFIPLFGFWFLDAYFLWQERLYRKLFDWIRENRIKSSEYLFDMNAKRFTNEVQTKFRIMFSITLGFFYGSILIILIIYSFLLFKYN